MLDGAIRGGFFANQDAQQGGFAYSIRTYQSNAGMLGYAKSQV